MRAIHYMKVDFRKSRKYAVWFLLFFAVVAVAGSIYSSDLPVVFGIPYLCFGGLVIVSQPFFSGNDSFVQMLPITTGERVLGRFLYGAALMLAYTAAGICAALIASMVLHTSLFSQELWFLACVACCLSWMMIFVEFALFYCLEIKQVQVMSAIRMVGAFAVFFGFSSLMEQETFVSQAAGWLAVHHTLAMAGLAGMTLLVFAVSLLVSIAHEKRKCD